MRNRGSVQSIVARTGPLKVIEREDTCDVYYVDEEKVRRVLRKVSSDERFEDLARIFQLLSDPTRVKLLYALAQEELCVCDLANIVGRSRPAFRPEKSPVTGWGACNIWVRPFHYRFGLRTVS
jgi:hypothetical protein